MKKIVIFGTGKIAEVIHYCFETDLGIEVSAFTVDREFKEHDKFCGKSVISFEELEDHCSPQETHVFVAIGYHDLNRLRASKILEVKAKGYEITNCIYEDSLPVGTVVGENCFVMKGANIHPHVELGNNVFVWSGAMIGHHSRIGDHNWFTSSANVGGNVIMGNHCFLAMNTTVSHSVKVGNNVFLGANSLVTKDLEDGQVVIAAPDKPIKLNSDQFLRMSGFKSL